MRDVKIELGVVPDGQPQPNTWQWYAESPDGEFSWGRGYLTKFGAQWGARRWVKQIRRIRKVWG